MVGCCHETRGQHILHLRNMPIIGLHLSAACAEEYDNFEFAPKGRVSTGLQVYIESYMQLCLKL